VLVFWQHRRATADRLSVLAARPSTFMVRTGLRAGNFRPRNDHFFLAGISLVQT
jgi:hypothetical protein